MKKPVLLAALAVGVVAIVRKRRSSRADADLWREATGNDRPEAPIVRSPLEGSPSGA